MPLQLRGHSIKLLHPSGLVVQIIFLEFSEDGLADLGNEFTDGGSANQPVILQEGVGFSCCQVSQHYCCSSPTSKGFLKLVTDFLIWRFGHSSMRYKRQVSIVTKFLYSGISVCIKSDRRLLWHIFLVLEVSRT